MISNIHMKFLNRYIWTIDGILTGTTNPGLCGPGSNNNEGCFYIPHLSKTETSLQGRVSPWCNG